MRRTGLEWECNEGILGGLSLLRCQTAALYVVMPALGKDVGCLPMVTPNTVLSVAINYSKIRRDCVHLFRCYWSLVVFTDNRDLCSLNRESWLEICEIGKQGVSFAGCRLA